MSDADLLARIGGGDDGALGAFYDRLSSLAYGLAVRILGDADAAEDVVQEAFLRVWHRAAQYDASRGAPRPWFLRLVRNLAIDRRRAATTRERVETRGSLDAALLPVLERPDDLAMRRERAHQLRSALATLPVEQQRALEIAYFEGLSHSEIAAREGMPLGTVKTRIRDGVLKLRTVIQGAMSHA
jgi:RNA polymerase sigma-70 factor (ECF subfamily)